MAALFASVSFHYLLIQRLPALPVGNTPAMTSHERTRAVIMRDVAREPVPALDRPPSFQPTDPTRSVGMTKEAEAFLRALEPVLPEAGLAADRSFASRGVTAEDAGKIEGRTAWEPRQDIIQIQQRHVREELAILPRRIVSSAPGVPDAPDIVLPNEGVLLAREPSVLPDVAPHHREAHAFVADPGLVPEVAFSPLGDDAIPVDPGSPEVPLEEIGEEEDELESVEQLLMLDLRTFRPVDEADVTYFRINIRRQADAVLPVLPRDVLILQDCSESMTQRKLEACKAGLYSVLDSLVPADRVEILAFREKTSRCFDSLTEVGPAAREQAGRFVQSLKARGKTDVYESLRETARIPRAAGRPMIALLVTDGRPTTGVVDSSDIIEGFTRKNDGGISVFGLGGGMKVNRFLLDMLSSRNRGDSVVEKDHRQISRALAKMAEGVRRPVLMDLTYRFTGIKESDVFPSTLTHLYLDRPVVLYGRVVGQPPAAVQIVGDAAGGRRDMVFPIDWPHAQPGDSGIRTQWAWRLIFDLIGQHTATRQPGLLGQVHSVARRYGLRVPYGNDMESH